jgi:2-methylcitrate dehydratase PrpD
VLRHDCPTNGLERKFSMQYCAAAALATGRVDLTSFDDGPVADEAMRGLMTRVRMVVDPTLPQGLDQHAWTRVTVRLRDGRTLDSPPRGASGHPDQPLTDAQLRDKFLACAGPVLGPDEADGVATQLTHLEDIPDIRALTARLVTARS